MRLVTVIAVLLCSISWLDAAPKITGELTANAGKLVRLKADQLPEKSTLRWRVTPTADRADTVRELLQFTGAPGEYRVELLVVSPGPEGSFEIAEESVTVRIQGVEQSPPPRPAPPARPDPARAVSRIQFGRAGCTAAPIGPRRADGRWLVLTAAHCLEKVGDVGMMTLQDSRRIGVRVVAMNRLADCAWLLTEQPVDSLPFAELADSDSSVGAEVWHAGFGEDAPGNRESGIVQAGPNLQGKVQFLLSVSRGDSGGPIVDKSTGKVVSTVCCTTGLAIKSPMFGASVRIIRELMNSIPTSESSDQWEPVPLPKCVIYPVLEGAK